MERKKNGLTLLHQNHSTMSILVMFPITDDENAKGRILEVTLWDILKGDPSQHQYKNNFPNR